MAELYLFVAIVGIVWTAFWFAVFWWLWKWRKRRQAWKRYNDHYRDS